VPLRCLLFPPLLSLLGAPSDFLGLTVNSTKPRMEEFTTPSSNPRRQLVENVEVAIGQISLAKKTPMPPLPAGGSLRLLVQTAAPVNATHGCIQTTSSSYRVQPSPYNFHNINSLPFESNLRLALNSPWANFSKRSPSPSLPCKSPLSLKLSFSQYQRSMGRFLFWLNANFVGSLRTSSVPAYSNVLESYLVSLSASQAASSLRTFLAAATFFHTLQLWPFSPHRHHWSILRAFPRFTSPTFRGWWSPSWFTQFSTYCSFSEQWHCLGVFLAFVYLLRISEIARITISDFSETSLRIVPSKSNGRPVWRPIAPAILPVVQCLRAYATPQVHLSSSLISSKKLSGLPPCILASPLHFTPCVEAVHPRFPGYKHTQPQILGTLGI